MTAMNQGQHGTIVIDDRFAPLIVTTFLGELEISQGRWFEETIVRLIQRQYSNGKRIVNIHDASQSARTRPEMRRFWAEMSARNERLMELQTLGNPIVVTNPLLRGVITAVGWLNPRVAKLEIFSSLEVALEHSLELLRREGTPVSLPPGEYRAPAPVHREAPRPA